MSGALDVASAAAALREQGRFSRGRSPLYERIFAALAGAIERGSDSGALTRLLATPGPTTLQEARLLLVAALHHAALADPTVAHAAWFPTAVASPRAPDDGAPGLRALAYLVDHEGEVREFLASQRLQTNEVGRCVGLLPGFLHAASFGHPLRLLEVGCSAGLNLRFDRYRYHYLQGPSWGPVGGPLLEATAEGAVPANLVPPSVEVSERRGVDLHPIDPTTDEGRRLLTSFVWPDEHDRHRRLREALAVARATPVRLERRDLVAWVSAEVAPQDATTTVVFHSSVEYQLGEDTLGRFDAAIERALRAGSSDAPVVHLRLEEPRGTREAAELTIATGDGSGPPHRRTVLTCDWHGRWVRWW